MPTVVEAARVKETAAAPTVVEAAKNEETAAAQLQVIQSSGRAAIVEARGAVWQYATAHQGHGITSSAQQQQGTKLE